MNNFFASLDGMLAKKKPSATHALSTLFHAMQGIFSTFEPTRIGLHDVSASPFTSKPRMSHNRRRNGPYPSVSVGTNVHYVTCNDLFKKTRRSSPRRDHTCLQRTFLFESMKAMRTLQFSKAGPDTFREDFIARCSSADHIEGLRFRDELNVI